MFFIQAEPQRLDQVQPGARSQRQTPGGPGIVGDFRMKHDDVEARRHAADLIINGLSFQERLVPEKQIMYLSLR